MTAESAATPPRDLSGETRLGVGYGFTAYAMWGLLPLYFVLLAPTGPWETLSWRVLLSLVFCALLLTVTRGWGPFLAIFRRPRTLLWTAVAGILIYGNWQGFLLAAQTGHVLEASLGYFINPIATIALAVVFLSERLRPLQWVAVGVAAVAVGVIVVFYGSVPWLSLLLAGTFALYSLVKKKFVGASVDAVSGLTLETMWLVPVATVQLVIVGATTGLTLGHNGTTHTILLLLAGVITAVPLLLFNAASRRVPLATVGMLQFAAPIMQFLTGVFLLHEEMPPERWAGFAIVWVACLLLFIDMWREARVAKR